MDEYGLKRAKVTFSYGPNDNRLIAHAVEMGNRILEAAGGKPRYVVPDTAHLMGGCRMGDDPATSVVDADCRAHDVPNLYICSAAVFPTSGGANPTHTVMALAARTAARFLERLQVRGRARSGGSGWRQQGVNLRLSAPLELADTPELTFLKSPKVLSTPRNFVRLLGAPKRARRVYPCHGRGGHHGLGHGRATQASPPAPVTGLSQLLYGLFAKLSPFGHI